MRVCRSGVPDGVDCNSLCPPVHRLSQGGKPASFARQLAPEAVTIPFEAPDLLQIAREDEASEKQGMPQRVAVSVPVMADIQQAGNWEISNDGAAVWRLRLYCKGALATSVCFDDFHLPEGARLFLYDDKKEFVIGAFFVLQSGQPWETWSYEPYRQYTSSTSDTNRYAEPAGLEYCGQRGRGQPLAQ